MGNMFLIVSIVIIDEFVQSQKRKNVMLKLVQHLTKSMCYETLKQVQGDKSGLFTRPSLFVRLLVFLLFLQASLCLNSQFFDLFMNRLVIDLEQAGCFGLVSSGML